MKKLKGVIRNRIHSAFEQFREDKNLRNFTRTIANIADCSVRSQGNANIMYEQINKETENGKC